jgi:hypothetical protein
MYPVGKYKDKVTVEWRKLHNEEFHDLYSSPTIVRVIKSRRMRWAEHVAWMGEERGVYRILVGKSEGKRPLGRTRCRILLEKLIGLKLIKKFPACYGTRRFITAFTSVGRLSLSLASPIQSIPHIPPLEDAP